MRSSRCSARSCAGSCRAIARLAARGRVELSTTPHYHPLAPLLLDFAVGARGPARRCRCRRASGYPGGAGASRAHLDAGARQPRAALRRARRGRVAGRGRDVGAARRPARERGVRWIAIGEGVLVQPLCAGGGRARPPTAPLSLPAVPRVADTGITCFFRDDRLSDLIGFEYSKWHGDDAAAHFVGELEAIAAHAAARRDAARERDPRRRELLGVLPVQRLLLPRRRSTGARGASGRSARRPLPRRARAQPRPADAAAPRRRQLGVRQLHHLDRLAGEEPRVGPARARPSRASTWSWRPGGSTDAERSRGAERQLADCEGSDWFWWIGDYNPAHAVAGLRPPVPREPRRSSTACSSCPSRRRSTSRSAAAAGTPSSAGRCAAPPSTRRREDGAAPRRARAPAGRELPGGAGPGARALLPPVPRRRCTAIPEFRFAAHFSGPLLDYLFEHYPRRHAAAARDGGARPGRAVRRRRHRAGARRDPAPRPRQPAPRAVRRSSSGCSAQRAGRRLAHRAGLGVHRGAGARRVRHPVRHRRRLPLPLRRQDAWPSSTATSRPRRAGRGSTSSRSPRRCATGSRSRPRAEAVAFIERRQRRGAAIYFDDIEKFGIWPETYEWVYGKGWLEAFIEGCSRPTGSRRCTFREYRARAPTRGIVYLPDHLVHRDERVDAAGAGGARLRGAGRAREGGGAATSARSRSCAAASGATSCRATRRRTGCTSACSSSPTRLAALPRGTHDGPAAAAAPSRRRRTTPTGTACSAGSTCRTCGARCTARWSSSRRASTRSRRARRACAPTSTATASTSCSSRTASCRRW